MIDTYTSALDWLGRGWSVFPCVPGSNEAVQGFGYLSDKALITTQQEAAEYFQHDFLRYNLAVKVPSSAFVLRMEWFLYSRWIKYVKEFDQLLPLTYSEITPSGQAVNLFFASRPVSFPFTFCSGVVSLRASLVAPSEIRGMSLPYEVFSENDLYRGSLDAALYPLRSENSALLRDTRKNPFMRSEKTAVKGGVHAS